MPFDLISLRSLSSPHAPELLAGTELVGDGAQVRQEAILADPAGRVAVGAEVLRQRQGRGLEVEVEGHGLAEL